MVNLIDYSLPVLNFGQFVDFFVHEELTNNGYFDEFGKGLDNGMGHVVIEVGGGSIVIELGVVG